MFTPVKTGDGSSTFYSKAFGEWFHSREGACREAQKTYVETAGLKQRVQQKVAGAPLRILDICYGLGYNTAAALAAIWAVDEACWVDLKALEIDIEVARSAIAQNLTKGYPLEIQQILQHLAADHSAEQSGLHAEILLGDARQQLQRLVSQGWRADVIFLDPFSPPNCPQLWTAEFLKLVAESLNPKDGVLVTYSCAAAVRAALKSAGLAIGSVQSVARQWPGTLACHSASRLEASLPPLSQQEKEHLLTKAAIPYRDPTLQSTAQEILKRRVQEQSISPLVPTNPWRRRWNLRKRNGL